MQSFPLYCSLFGRISIALYGIAIGILAHCNTALFVGAVQSIGTISCIISLIISKKMLNDPDKNFQYGYAKFEPAAINGEALLFIGMSIMLVLNSLHHIIDPQSAPNLITLPIVLRYALLTSIISTIIFCIFLYKKKEFHSYLFRSNLTYWGIDTLMAILMAIGFFSAEMMAYSQYAAYTVYVDPAITVLFGLISIKVPSYYYKDTLQDLVDASPDQATQKKIQEIIDDYIKQQGKENTYQYTLSMRRAGREIFLVIKPQIKTENDLESYRLDKLITKQLKIANPQYKVHFDLS